MLAIAIPLGLIVSCRILLLVRLQRRQWRAEAALAVARDQARDASRLKTEFLSRISRQHRHRCHPTGEGRVGIVVRDTGPGIPADKMERLFMPFDRLGPSRPTCRAPAWAWPCPGPDGGDGRHPHRHQCGRRGHHRLP